MIIAHCFGAGPGTLRGGAWNNEQTNARVSARNHNQPDNFNNNNSFRVVVAPDFYGVPRLRTVNYTLIFRSDDILPVKLLLYGVQPGKKKTARSGPGRAGHLTGRPYIKTPRPLW